MDNFGKFPLLCLPFLAIEEVLSTMAVFDLVNFSMASCKTKLITKSITSTQKKRYETEMIIDSEPKLFVWRGRDVFVYEMTLDESKSDVYSWILVPHTIHKYSEDVLEGFKKWTKHVVDVLSAKICDISFCTDVFSDRNKSTIDWLKSFSKSIGSISIRNQRILINSNELDDETVTYLFQNLKITEKLDVILKLSENFDSSLVPKVSESILVVSCRWFSIQDILNIGSFRTNVVSSKSMKINDLRTFISSWMSLESYISLNFFEVSILSENQLNEIMETIPHERIGEEIERSLLPSGRMIKGGIDIFRTDGKRATLFVENSALTVCSLIMVVN